MSEFYSMGDKVVPPPRPADDADTVYGDGWIARRTSDGARLSWDGGDIVGRPVEVAIAEAEFERLRSDHAAFLEIARRHDPNA